MKAEPTPTKLATDKIVAYMPKYPNKPISNQKEKLIINEFRILISKTKIASFGLNYQNCRNQIFASLDFSFEGLYQAIRRSYGFGQTNEIKRILL